MQQRANPVVWTLGMFFLCLAVALCSAQDNDETALPKLKTDRPSQTDDSSTVPLGYVQAELGWTRTRNDDRGIKAERDAVPETLIRIGITEGIELRVGFEGQISQTVTVLGAKVKDIGAGDASIGTKIGLIEEQGPVPELAFIMTTTLPTGEVSSERVDPSFRLAASNTFEQLDFSYNLGIAWESAEDLLGDRDTVSSLEYGMSLGMAATDRLGAYAELFGDVSLSRSGGPRHSLGVGGTFLLEDNLQADVSAGFGLSSVANDWFLGIGFSYRFPN